MFKLKPSKPDQGFTLFGVLVSILIASIFVAIAMQSMVLAAFFQVRAKEMAEATLWIQENLETVKNQAVLANLPYTGNTTRCGSAITQTTGFADKLRDQVVGSDSSATSSTTNFTKIFNATNKSYKLQRIATPSSSSPHNVLQLSYQVIDEQPSPDRIVAQLYTEVIPDAALQCL